MIGSLTTFARRQLGIKGKTEHNGRGAWEMGFDVSHSELERRMREKLEVWQSRGLVEAVQERKDDDSVNLFIMFKEEVVKNVNYRVLRLGNHKEFGPVLQVCFD